MPQRLKKTKAHRALKEKKMGAKAKHKRENHGTTHSVPLKDAPLVALRGGQPIKADKIKVPAHLLK